MMKRESFTGHDYKMELQGHNQEIWSCHPKHFTELTQMQNFEIQNFHPPQAPSMQINVVSIGYHKQNKVMVQLWNTDLALDGHYVWQRFLSKLLVQFRELLL
jgi:hypothetical protein